MVKIKGFKLVTFIIISFVFITVVIAQEVKPRVEIFTIHDVRVSGNAQNIYYVDNLNILQHKLNQLVATKYQLEGGMKSMQAAKAFVSRNRKQYMNAMNTIQKIQLYDVEKVPAVVIAGKYQILGATDSSRALKIYHRFMLNKNMVG